MSQLEPPKTSPEGVARLALRVPASHWEIAVDDGFHEICVVGNEIEATYSFIAPVPVEGEQSAEFILQMTSQLFRPSEDPRVALMYFHENLEAWVNLPAKQQDLLELSNSIKTELLAREPQLVLPDTPSETD